MSSLFERLMPPAPSEDVEAFHQGYLLVVASFLTALFSAAYTVLHAYAGFTVGAVTMAAVTVIFFVLPPLFRHTGSLPVVAHLFMLVGTAAILITTYYSAANEIMPWLAAVPLVAVLLAGKRQGSLWAVAAVALTALFTLLDQNGYPFPLALGRDHQPLWELLVRVGLPLLVFFLALVFQHEKERAFRRLHARNETLQHALTDLEQAQTQLIQHEKLASLGQLTAGVAHEIKNPLNFVNNFAALTRDLADDLREAVHDGDAVLVNELLDDLQENTARIEQHGRRADGIVRSMMAHARQEAGPREEVDLNTLVEEHVALAFHSQRARQPDFAVHLDQHSDAESGTVEAVRGEIGRVLLNLLDNAFYAAEAARLQCPNAFAPTVRVETARVNGHVEVRVRDNGPGIPEDVQHAIFEPFFTTKPAGEGTGLGLSLSHDIVSQRHGGALTVESTEGEGTTFTVTLPAPQTHETSAKRRMPLGLGLGSPS